MSEDRFAHITVTVTLTAQEYGTIMDALTHRAIAAWDTPDEAGYEATTTAAADTLKAAWFKEHHS